MLDPATHLLLTRPSRPEPSRQALHALHLARVQHLRRRDRRVEQAAARTRLLRLLLS